MEIESALAKIRRVQRVRRELKPWQIPPRGFRKNMADARKQIRALRHLPPDCIEVEVAYDADGNQCGVWINIKSRCAGIGGLLRGDLDIVEQLEAEFEGDLDATTNSKIIKTTTHTRGGKTKRRAKDSRTNKVFISKKALSRMRLKIGKLIKSNGHPS